MRRPCTSWRRRRIGAGARWSSTWRGHPQFPAEFQELIGELGDFIETRGVDSDLQDDGGIVTVHGTVPNANHPEVRELLYGEGAAAGSPLRERSDELRRRGRAGTLPLIEFSQRVELVREGEHWKAFLDWAVGFTIHFRAAVREQLPFEFSVQPASITLKPGETGSATFHAKNVSQETVRAKAGHLFDPPVAFLHTELVECFCFFEDTYAPGEERELPVAVRLGWDIPAGTSARSPCCTSTTRWTNSATAGPPRRAMGRGQGGDKAAGMTKGTRPAADRCRGGLALEFAHRLPVRCAAGAGERLRRALQAR